jgi:hypothetical protein
VGEGREGGPPPSPGWAVFLPPPRRRRCSSSSFRSCDACGVRSSSTWRSMRCCTRRAACCAASCVCKLGETLAGGEVGSVGRSRQAGEFSGQLPALLRPGGGARKRAEDSVAQHSSFIGDPAAASSKRQQASSSSSSRWYLAGVLPMGVGRAQRPVNWDFPSPRGWDFYRPSTTGTSAMTKPTGKHV